MMFWTNFYSKEDVISVLNNLIDKFGKNGIKIDHQIF